MKPEDKNMLEYAAKACGIELNYWCPTNNAFWCGEYWNPLTNSADCAAMCAKLAIDTRWYCNGESVTCIQKVDLWPGWSEHTKDHNNDREAAWRYAATMVAAKIGGFSGD